MTMLEGQIETHFIEKLGGLRCERDDRTPDEQGAYSVARWLQATDSKEFLNRYFEPALTGAERKVAMLEGWILRIA